MTKRVLLTGAGGFVGHHTLAHLLKTTDWEVVATDSFRHRGTSARLRSVAQECPKDFYLRASVITHDLTTPIDAVTAREIGDVDYIINMASDSHVDRSITDPVPFVRNNTDLILTMLEYARVAQPAKFLQVSTDEVYGPALDDYDHVEWDVVLPSNPYAASKACQEAIAVSYWRTYGVPLIISNTMNIIGERQDTEKFVPMVISNLVHGQTVPIHARRIDGAWEAGSRFYLHARNQADALRFLLEEVDSPLHAEQARPTRVHVVGEREVRNDEMARLIADAIIEAGHAVTGEMEYVNFHGSRPGHDLRYALDGNLLSSLGWKPPVPLEESLRRTVQWTLDHPEWMTVSG